MQASIRGKDGKIVGKDQFMSFGHHFYCTVYKTLINFTTIDRIIEIVWYGPEDDYGTTTGGFGAGFTRYTITPQVNKQLNQRVQKALKIGVAAVVKDNVVRLQKAQ